MNKVPQRQSCVTLYMTAVDKKNKLAKPGLWLCAGKYLDID